MTKHHFNDLIVGETLTCKPFNFTENEVLRFCREYDAQFFHTDPVRAKDSHFGGLVASGWQTASMALNVLTRQHLRFPEGIIGLGVDHIRWKAPVFPDDQLTPEATIIEKRLSGSRPGYGIAIFDLHVTNQHREIVLQMRTNVMIRMH